MDLTYLISISDGDLEFIRDFISTYEKSTLNQIDLMEKEFENKNYEEVKKLAHQLKPTTELLMFETHSLILTLNTSPELGSLIKMAEIKKEAFDVLQGIKDQFNLS